MQTNHPLDPGPAPAISLDAATVITQRSRSTWWRRIRDGSVRKLEPDLRGRTMLAWEDVMPHLCIDCDEEDIAMIVRADAGDPAAQADVGQLFAVHQKPVASLYWMQLAARQDEPDAMQWLGGAYAAGRGVERDANLSIMWIARAAAAGHVIALGQMEGMRGAGAALEGAFAK